MNGTEQQRQQGLLSSRPLYPATPLPQPLHPPWLHLSSLCISSSGWGCGTPSQMGMTCWL